MTMLNVEVASGKEEKGDAKLSLPDIAGAMSLSNTKSADVYYTDGFHEHCFMRYVNS